MDLEQRERVAALVAEHRRRVEEFDLMILDGINNPVSGPPRHMKARTPWWRRLFRRSKR